MEGIPCTSQTYVNHYQKVYIDQKLKVATFRKLKVATEVCSYYQASDMHGRLIFFEPSGVWHIQVMKLNGYSLRVMKHCL